MPNIMQQFGRLPEENTWKALNVCFWKLRTLFIIIMISKCNREVRVQGLGRLSLKYIENFFKKAGSISKISVHKHYVIIRYSSELEARNALSFNGKILEQEQLVIKLNRQAEHQNHSRRDEQHRNISKHYREDRKTDIKQPLYQVPSTLFNYEELDIEKNHFQARNLILGLSVSEFKKALLFVIFEHKKMEVEFLINSKENVAFNQSIGFLESLFNEDIAVTPKNVNGKDFFTLKLKDVQTNTSQVKMIADWAESHQKFFLNLTAKNQRLGKLYLMFHRESLISTTEVITPEEGSCPVLQPFFGCVSGSFSSVIFNPFKKLFTQNIILYRQQGTFDWKLERFNLVARLPKLKCLEENSFSNLYKINGEGPTRQRILQLPDSIYVMEMDNKSIHSRQCLEVILRKYALFTQLQEKTGSQSLFLTFYSNNQAQQTSTLKLLSQFLQCHHPLQINAVSVTSITLFQAFLHEQFITNYVDNYKGEISQETAIFLAKTLVKDRPDELFGTYNITTIAAEIMNKNAEKSKRRTQNLIDRYSLSTV